MVNKQQIHMKNLKNYVKDCIVESIWDIEDNVEDDNNEFIIDKIKQFIKDNYETVDLKFLTFVFNEKKDKYVVNSDQHVRLKSNSDTLTNEVFEWGTVSGSFGCSYCLIKTLEGAPREVGGDFNCSGCHITTLKGAPKVVKWYFYCENCTKLKSLKGAPEYVGADFYCHDCPNLHSLDGIGEVGGEIFSDIE